MAVTYFTSYVFNTRFSSSLSVSLNLRSSDSFANGVISNFRVRVFHLCVLIIL